MKTKKPFTTIKLNLTIQSDESGEIWDININDGYRSISFDGDRLPTLKEILQDFDY